MRLNFEVQTARLDISPQQDIETIAGHSIITAP
jgi:hypothetical protein